MFGAALARWYGGKADSDYDEPWNNFQARCRNTLEHVLQQVKGDETHMVVTSGGVIAVIAQALLGLDDAATMRLNWTLANAGMTTLQVSRSNKQQLLSLNEHSHFRGHHHHLLTWR
ncbi:Histidine phosphatase superfamily [compost metagenome]